MLQTRFSGGGVELVDAEPRPLEQGWVRLAVEACGICGSDLHMMRGHTPVPGWLVPGHEMVGVPVDGPAGLDEARYAVEPRVWCGSCDFCSAGSRHLCPTGTLIGFGYNGGLSETVDVPLKSLHRVPGDTEALAASLSEPVAVCVRAIHLARLEAGSRVLVLGGGTIGLLSGLLARDRAERVAITTRHPHQQEAAKRLGLLALSEEEAAEWALANGPDVVIETVGGLAETLDQAVLLCRPGGRIVVLGVFAGSTPINGLVLLMKELEIIASNTYGTTQRGSEFAAGVELVARYASELTPLQTHQFGLDAVGDAFACADDKRSGAIKVTVLPRSPR
jgi:threonine dehydrogenase-like Zn-dependent dehydrogenase